MSFWSSLIHLFVFVRVFLSSQGTWIKSTFADDFYSSTSSICMYAAFNKRKDFPRLSWDSDKWSDEVKSPIKVSRQAYGVVYQIKSKGWGFCVLKMCSNRLKIPNALLCFLVILFSHKVESWSSAVLNILLAEIFNFKQGWRR